MQVVPFPCVTENMNNIKERERVIEQECFTPLVFPAAGGMGLAVQVACKPNINLI